MRPAVSDPDPKDEVRLETAQPLESSLLWRWQQRYYQRRAADAWASGEVPWRITSTPLLAEALAATLEGYARDTLVAGVRTPDQPLCVLDLGAGAGRLASLLCEQLSRAGVRYQYVMTDLAAANVAAWQRHPRLKALAEAGVLDFAVADAGHPEALGLVARGAVWEPGALPGPLVAIGGYLFDSLPHAAWRKQRGALQAGRVTLWARGDALGLDPPALERIDWELTFEAALAVPPFVRGYAQSLEEGPFLVPVGAFACLRALARLGGGRYLCLAADKGPRTAAQLQAPPFPPLARHGCVSASVNFHALRAWAGFRDWLEPAQPDPAFGVYGVAQGLPPRALASTRAAFAAHLGDNAPLRAEQALQALVEKGERATPDELVAGLESSRCSPDALLRLAPQLRSCAATLRAPQLAALVEALDRTWRNHFELGEPADLAFEIATVLHRAGQLRHAVRHYHASLDARGDHPTTAFNLALCAIDLGDAIEARAQLGRVLALAPDHARAKELLAALAGRTA